MDATGSLSDFLPAAAWTTEQNELAARTRDWWPITAVRHRRGAIGEVLPAVVILPRSTEEVAAALRWATLTRTPIVPRGGGSGVCGGVHIEGEGWAVLDLSRMAEILDLDLESQVVRVQAGIRGGRLEAWLNERGLTLGHSPQSVELSSVGGWIAASSAGQFTPAYGAIEDRLLGYTAVTGDGVTFNLRPVPRSAAAPNLRRLLMGTEGTLAVVTEAALACAPVPKELAWQAFRFDGFESALRWARSVNRLRVAAHVLRGYDEADALACFHARFDHRRGAVGLAGFERDLPRLEERLAAVTVAAHNERGKGVDAAYGEHWLEHRLDAVQTFEIANGPARALGEGAMLDTMETAALWRDLPGLYRAATDAIAAHADEVRCHFSHVYPAGAALYFTFVLHAADDERLEAVYAATWQAALDACLALGGSITHHHGMGRLRAARAADELGVGTLEIMHRLKSVLDPAGVLNPGALLPGALRPGAR